MRSDKTGIFLITRTDNKKRNGDNIKWTKVEYQVLTQSKGKTLLIPLKGTENYFELFEITNITSQSVQGILYNYNDWTGGTAFANKVVITKPNSKDGVRIINVESKKLESSDIQNTPIPFCNAVAKKDKLGKINCQKKTFLQNMNFAEAWEIPDKVKIRNIDISDYKNPKVIAEFEEKKQNKNLYKHLFKNIEGLKPIEKENKA